MVTTLPRNYKPCFIKSQYQGRIVSLWAQMALIKLFVILKYFELNDFFPNQVDREVVQLHGEELER